MSKRRDDLQRQYDLLSEKLAGLEEELIRETRTEEKFRLRSLIADTKTALERVEAELQKLQKTPKQANTMQEEEKQEQEEQPKPDLSGEHSEHLWEKIAAFVFGVVFVLALLVLAIAFPDPTPFQYLVFRIVLALACAGVAAVIPGFLSVRTDTAGILIRAGGALAVFVLVYTVDPAAQLVLEPKPPTPVPVEQPLVGSVWNDAGHPFPDVQVSLPEFSLTTTTDNLGRFRFQVTALKEAQVELLAQKAGYQTHNQYVTLGNTTLSFTMRKES